MMVPIFSSVLQNSGRGPNEKETKFVLEDGRLQTVPCFGLSRWYLIFLGLDHLFVSPAQDKDLIRKEL